MKALFLALAAFIPLVASGASSCDINKAQLVLPPNQTALTPPIGPPLFIAAAFGVQNYTCNATSHTYTSTGAVAELLDISCLYGKPGFQNAQNDLFNSWSLLPSSVTIQDAISLLDNAPTVLGQHYFIKNPIGTTPAILPKWDFTSTQHNADAFVVGSKVGDLTAPTGSADVDWLQLKGVEGSLAKTIYRTDTKGGQPPASCTAGSPPLSVKYASKYWFF